MQIDIQSFLDEQRMVDRSDFTVKTEIRCGEVLYLVYPNHIGATWSKDNLCFRSSIFNSNGELISAGFKKFFNYGESSHIVEPPKSLNSCSVIEKLDGSLLSVTKYKGETIQRTRGTFSAYSMENGYEIDELKLKYPLAFDNRYINNNEYSLIFEWLSPKNKIILNYGDSPDIKLIGCVSHEDYSYKTNKELDIIAKELGVGRPEVYSFNTLEELISIVSGWKGKEGVCLYFNSDQNIVKIKGSWYLNLHKIKSSLNTFESVLDLWLDLDRPDYLGFYNHICTVFDFELAEQLKKDISIISDAYKEVNRIVEHMREKTNSLKGLTRKDAAIEIIKNYGQTNRASFAFSLLDGKELDRDQIKKLMFQVTKK